MIPFTKFQALMFIHFMHVVMEQNDTIPFYINTVSVRVELVVVTCIQQRNTTINVCNSE